MRGKFYSATTSARPCGCSPICLQSGQIFSCYRYAATGCTIRPEIFKVPLARLQKYRCRKVAMTNKLGQFADAVSERHGTGTLVLSLALALCILPAQLTQAQTHLIVLHTFEGSDGREP